MIIASFMRVVYSLKHPSNVYICLNCLDNGSCWNVIYLECQNVIGALTIMQVLLK